MTDVLGPRGSTAFFTVSLDTIELGMWYKISGLGMSVDTTARKEFGMTIFQHNLPAHLVYDKITLTRWVSTDSVNVLNWLTSYHMLPVPTSGQITAHDQMGTPIAVWEMFGVSPVAWKGPDLDATNSTNVATESLTIAHMGFM